jgi:hypothetical protein
LIYKKGDKAMERLTEKCGDRWIPRQDIRNNGHDKCMAKLAEYEDTGLTPEEINKLNARMPVLLHQREQLAEYLKAEEQGLLIKRRIKPLDKVYHIIGTVKPGGKLIKEVRESVIYSITEYAGGILQGTRYEAYDGWNFYEQDIGVKAFITIEAAEEALKGAKTDE